MMNLFARFGIAFVYMGVIITSSSFSEEIDVKNAIAIIKKQEKNIHSMAWTSNVKIVNADRSESLHQGTAKIAFDKNGRFRLEKSETRKWIGGPKPTNSVSIIATFDGEFLRSEEKSLPGDKIPDVKTVAQGKISKGREGIHECINWQGIPECIGFAYPFVGCWADVDTVSVDAVSDNIILPKLSDVLLSLVAQKKEIKINEDTKGIWHIVYPFHYFEDLKIQAYCRIDYDPGRGKSGAIISVQKGDEKSIVDLSLEPVLSFMLQPIGDFYFPNEIKIQYDYKDGIPTKYQYIYYKNIKINEDLSDSDFQIDWQKGTNVYDHVAKKFYVVTGNPVDEAEAVTAFKNIYGLNRHSVFDDNSRVVVFRIVLILLGLLLITYGFYLHFKKEKKKK